MQKISNLNSHPHLITNEITKLFLNEDYFLEFAYYTYFPQNMEENKHREIFKVSKNNYSVDFILNTLNLLSNNQELAFQSRVYFHNKVLYLPLIDFKTKKFELVISAIREMLPKEYLDNILFFTTGRSFHAYIIKLIEKEKWLSFLGTLLLFNKSKKIIDDRWVGHSLRMGYSALRWSNNSSHYKALPKYYAKISGSKLILSK